MQLASKQTAGFFVPAFFNVVFCKLQLLYVTLNLKYIIITSKMKIRVT